MISRRNTLSKGERLCGKKNIQELFNQGSSFYFFPFKVYYSLPTEAEGNHSALFSVPKRLVPKATKRNLIKRRIKEVYRKNKPEFYDIPISRPLIIAYIYTARKILNYADIESSMIRCQQILADKIHNTQKDEEKS
ncbi:ribonuclease P protein component [Marinigracilibium pacificum]|uniref:Ribonuclease P protein component n=1 Tax=Marinigracilibium pacificum TaxID=2729599 RepID=A0A848IVP8_9BACT|nr:ribonuclease P protein component [Marinigracilibium pacificum]NMM47258.1 ribonuclease P protein component [Marinigracilibium pacificum]